MSEHAPLPFKLGNDPSDKSIYALFKIAEMRGGESTRDRANAEFIVRACNSHYELVEALENRLEDMQDQLAIAVDHGHGGLAEALESEILEAKSLLAKAKGEQQ